jgi:putative metallopeptidase DUF4344
MKALIPLVVIAWAVCAGTARSGQIEIEYVAPKNPSHQHVYQRLQDLQVLESLRELLRPFRLPRTLTFKIDGCDGESNAWYDNDVVTVCYEYLDDVWENAYKRTTFEGVAQVDVMLGPLFDVFLHEFGHAAFEHFDVPLFGREEDAADQFSAYIMLHMGKEEARRLILGTAYAYKVEAEIPEQKPTMSKYADEHGTPAQRFYNLLCVAYGADAKLFEDLIAKGYLPNNRAEGCAEEFQQLRKAFQRLIDPHVDQSLAKEVMQISELSDRAKKKFAGPRQNSKTRRSR